MRSVVIKDLFLFFLSIPTVDEWRGELKWAFFTEYKMVW